jgi:hypothetical protein
MSQAQDTFTAMECGALAILQGTHKSQRLGDMPYDPLLSNTTGNHEATSFSVGGDRV